MVNLSVQNTVLCLVNNLQAEKPPTSEGTHILKASTPPLITLSLLFCKIVN